ncbi:MAG: SGNH/GDSL hydrolase family protein [Fimbriimonadaceae bacterium]
MPTIPTSLASSTASAFSKGGLGRGRVIFIGDSFAEGAIGGSGADRKSFAQMMVAKSLGRYFLPAHGAGFNLATGGHTSTQVVGTQLPNIAKYTPDIVVVMCGGNDSTWPLSVAERDGMRNNWRTIANEITRIGAKPVFCTIPPTTATASSASKLASLWSQNRWLEMFCLANGYLCCPIGAVQTNPQNGMPLAAYDSGDGVHPSRAGASAWADILLATLDGNSHGYYPFLVSSNAEFWSTGYDGANMANANANSCFMDNTGAGTTAGWTSSAGTITTLAATGVVKGRWLEHSKTAAGSQTVFGGQVSLSGKWTDGETLVACGRIQRHNYEGSIYMRGLQMYQPSFAYTDFVTSGSNFTDNNGEYFYMEFKPTAGSTIIDLRLFVYDNGGNTGQTRIAQATLFNKSRLGF